MKNKYVSLIFLFAMIFSFNSFAQSEDPIQISLKITYEATPLCNWDITVKLGDVAVAKGVTDNAGFVKFDPTIITSKTINVDGYKKGANGDVNWSLKGYVTLDDNYFSHMHMEVYAKEAAAGTGFLTQADIAKSWGMDLNCDGTVGSASTTTTTTNNTTNTNPTNTTNTTTTTTTADPDQAIKDQKLALENQLVDYTKKITALDFEINQNKATMTPVDLKIKELEKQELEIRREECKIAIDRTNKTLDKSIKPDDLQNFTTKEQENKLKADAVAKQKTELVNLKNSNIAYAQQVKDLPTSMTTMKTELGTLPQANRLDSINHKIKSLQLEEMSYKYEAAKIGLDKTNKQIENGIATGAKPYTDESINTLQTQENEQLAKVTTTTGQINDQLILKKDAEKNAKKAANQEKLDDSKLKIKISSLKSQIKLKEKAIAKEQKKKKPDQVKIDEMQKSLNELKQELADAEKQLAL